MTLLWGQLWYVQGFHSEGPQQAGGMNQWGPPEIHEGKDKVLHL